MSQGTIRVVSGRVAQSNTPETDMKPEVMHIVHVVDRSTTEGFDVRVMAREPLDAMRIVGKMSREAVESLRSR